MQPGGSSVELSAPPTSPATPTSAFVPGVADFVSQRRRLWVWGGLGTVASVAMAVLATRIGNLPLVGHGAWWFSLPASWGGADSVPLNVAFYVAFAGLVWCWFGVGAELTRHPRPAWVPVVILIAWSVPLLVGPPAFSNDVYSYVAQGTLARSGLNPYQFGPVALGPGPIVSSVSRIWLFTPAPYGPLFVVLAAVASRAIVLSELAAVTAARMIAVVGVALIAGFLPRLARDLGVDANRALWLGLLSPLAVVGFVASSHNDALMLGLLVLGLVLAVEDHPLAAVFVCALAAAVKIPALAGAGFVAISWARQGDRRPAERAGVLLLAAAVAVVTLAASSLATGLGFGWLSPSVLSTPTDATILAAPVVAVGLSLAHIGSALGLSVSTSDTLGIAQVIGGLLAVAGGALIAWRTRGRGGAVGALALAFLLVVLLSPVLQPWYLTWGLVIAAATRAQRSPWMIVLAVAGAFLALPNGVDTISPPLEYVVALAAVAGLVWLLTGRRWQRALGLASEP